MTENKKKRVLAICGSTKKKSSNHHLLEFIAEEYKELMEVDLYDAIDRLPHFNPDQDTEVPPAAVADLRNRIAQADGVLFCTPEYVFSLPGSLKNAIEWQVSTTLFSNKPVALIVAAASGVKALESLHLIMTTIESRIPASSQLLIKGIKGKINAQGLLIHEETIQRIDQLIAAFLLNINSSNGIPSKFE